MREQYSIALEERIITIRHSSLYPDGVQIIFIQIAGNLSIFRDTHD